VFLGSPECVLVVLRKLWEAASSKRSFELVGVVTQSPKKVSKKGKLLLTQTAVHDLAEELGVPSIMAPESARDASFLDDLEALAPDLCITAAYGQYLPKRFLEMPKMGTLNLHPSLLPRWRGAAPVQRALEAGDEETGISILYTVAKMDAGPIALQRTMKLDGRETSEMLLDTLFTQGAELLVDEVFPRVFSGELTQDSAPEQDESFVTKAPLITKLEGQLWPHNETAKQMRDKIRAFSGWPTATLPIACTGSAAPPQGYRIKVYGADIMETAELSAEELARPVEELIYLKPEKAAVAVRPAADAEHALLLESFHVPGKKAPVPAKTFFKGYMSKQPAKWMTPDEEASMKAAKGGKKGKR